ncbi:MAG: hypothetical protein P8Y24_05915 [Gammaproteobacteria bacterium]
MPYRHLVLTVIIFSINIPASHGNVFVNPKSTQLNLYLGNLKADEETGVLEDSSSHVAIGLASSSQSRVHPYFAIDVEIWGLASEFRNTLPAPLFVSVNDEMQLDTAAITLGARLLYPYDSPYHLYISGGYGYFMSRIRVYANLFGIPGYYEDTSEEFAPYIGAGITFNLGYRQTLDIFYRKWQNRGDFQRFNIPETDLGGEAFGIGFGMYW